MKSMGNELSHWEAPPNPAGREEPLFDSQVARATPTCSHEEGMRAETLSVKKWSCDIVVTVFKTNVWINTFIQSFPLSFCWNQNSILGLKAAEWIKGHAGWEWCCTSYHEVMQTCTSPDGPFHSQEWAATGKCINIIITVQTISSPVHHVHRWWPPDHLKYYIIFKKSKTKISEMPRRTMWPSVRIHHFPAAPKQTGQVPGHKKSRSLCDPLNRIINSSTLLTTFQ